MKIPRLTKALVASFFPILLASCADMTGGGTSDTSDIPAEILRPKKYSVGSGTSDKLAALAAKHNPAIAALRHRAERMEAQAPQAASLPDPMASVSAGSMAETAAGQMQGMVGVSQKFPHAGKRDAASRAARHEAAAIRAEADALALKVSEQVKSAWWDYYLAEKTISYTKENRELLSSIKEIVAARIETDSASQADQLRTENEITLLDRDLADLRKLRSSAIARINSLLNRHAGSSLPPPREPSLPATSSLENLIARAQVNHPDIAAAQQRVDAFNQRLRKAKLERYPDPTVGITYAPVSGSGLAGSANGRDQVFATLGFNIPLWREPRKAMVREATAGIAETKALLESSRADLRYRVEDAYFRAKTAREVTTLFKDRLIPSAKQASEVTLTGYSAGKSSFTDVLETQREVLTYQLQLIKSRAELGKAIATLEAAAAL
jgi:cobalt-zinc-cadmium efflux system outer membrane protein